MSKFNYRRPYCEVRGRIGPNISKEGWSTCFDHFDAEKPEMQNFDSVTGEPIDPEQAPG